MILAAAIKYYIEDTKEEVVLCGCRHGDIFRQLKGLGFEARKGYKEIEQVFINHKREFLDRKEAVIHAKEYGQIAEITLEYKEKHSILPNELISEDLW